MSDSNTSSWSPEVGVLKVAAPCKADWNAMQGNAQVRFCALCKLNVYNLGGMTADAARAVVKASEGGALCLRFFQRPDGTVTVAQCPPGLSAQTRKRWALVAASGTAALALSLMGIELTRPSAEVEVSPLQPIAAAAAAPAALAPAAAPAPTPAASDQAWMEERRRHIGNAGREVTGKRMSTIQVIRGTGPTTDEAGPAATPAPKTKG
jgi:hypothetical protein